MNALEVRDLHAGYGAGLVLQGVSLDVAEGEAAVLLGRNGAGKTTTISALVGFLRPRSGSVLVRGRRAPIIGSVCMDMLMADVTGLDVSPGDEVVIIGAQGGDRIDVREMAAQIGTIPYEILCRIGSRIERLYE